MGSAKKVFKKFTNVATGGIFGDLFGGSKGGSKGGGGGGSANDAQQEAMSRQQKIERENQLMLQGSIGSESASTGGTVESGKAIYGGEFSPRKRKRDEYMSSSLGIM